nr:hypothetical protein [Tanacetum cinerariifolium]
VARIGFKIPAGEAAVLAQPAKRALDDPAVRQHGEALLVAGLGHDFDPQAQRGGRRAHGGAAVAPIAPEQAQTGGARDGFGQDGRRPGGVLHRGGLHLHGHEQAQGVNHQMALTASYLLAGVVAVTAPLLAPVRTDCVSMAPAVGSGARPAAWRTVRRKPSCNRSQVPSSRQASNCL